MGYFLAQRLLLAVDRAQLGPSAHANLHADSETESWWKDSLMRSFEVMRTTQAQESCTTKTK